MTLPVVYTWCCSAIPSVAVRTFCIIIISRILVWTVEKALLSAFTCFVAFWHVLFPLCMITVTDFSEKKISSLGSMLRNCLLLLLMQLQVGLVDCLNADLFSSSISFHQHPYLAAAHLFNSNNFRGSLTPSVLYSVLHPCAIVWIEDRDSLFPINSNESVAFVLYSQFVSTYSHYDKIMC